MTASNPGWRTATFDFTLCEVDPEVLGLLTGGALGTAPEPTFNVEIIAPVRRTFWQWLTRKPRRHQTIVIPNARLEERP